MIDNKKPILVTGSSGYIASWIVQYLLEDGHHVRATVRDKKNKKKIDHLEKIGTETKGKLELFEADLNLDGSFDEAIKGCELVIHTASPFVIGKVKNPLKDLIEPAENGTKNVLDGVNRSGGVKRVVLTSSVAAMYSDSIDVSQTPKGVFNEECWNTKSNLKHNPYSYSKTLAEKKAWEIHNQQNEWDLITINPSFVLGPSLSERIDGASVDFMRSLVNGKLATGVPKTEMGIVDVRDVAKAHIKAGLNPSAKGRHILAARSISILEIAKILKENFENKYRIPKKEVPKFVFYILGPIIAGLTWEWVSKNIGYEIKFDNSKSIKELGINYTDTKETLVSHIEQLEKSNLIFNK
ncbi:MAG: diaminohydroxyphosphoribosylaminopyrimidine deaminase [Halobacteriovoraceae bacterium]|nr:diaminohydroxyphosphoribosylaminopyrimidine deaminase [Halobacteriovoraceae bacterium]